MIMGAVIALPLLIAAPVEQFPYGTTGHLVQACSTPAPSRGVPNPVDQGAYESGVLAGYCRGMVIGVSAMASANSGMGLNTTIKACVGSASTAALIARFRTWAASNRGEWNEPAAVGFLVFLTQTFPCSR